MKIYLDYIFIENFLITAFCLYEVKEFASSKTSSKRIMLGSIVASVYVVAMLWLKISILDFGIVKLLLSLIISYISFRPKKIKEQIRLSLIYWIVWIINVGAIYVVQNMAGISPVNILSKWLIYAVCFSFSYICIKGFKITLANKQETKEYERVVKLNIAGKTYLFNSFLDTGNTVFSYLKNLPVIFALWPKNLVVKDMEKLESIKIKVETINGKSVETGYVVGDIEIDEMLHRAIVVFLENNKYVNQKYDMILNARMKLE